MKKIIFSLLLLLSVNVYSDEMNAFDAIMKLNQLTTGQNYMQQAQSNYQTNEHNKKVFQFCAQEGARLYRTSSDINDFITVCRKRYEH